MRDREYLKKQLKRYKSKGEMRKFVNTYLMVKFLSAGKPKEKENWKPLRSAEPVSIREILTER